MSDLELLPPIEKELLGKSLKELIDIARGYLQKNADLINRRALRDLPWNEQWQSEIYLDRAETAGWQAFITKAQTITENPHASPEEIYFAKHIIWNCQVNKLIDGAIPTHPVIRAKKINIDGSVEEKPAFISLKSAMEYDRPLSQQEINRIADDILSKYPDPDGKIWHFKDFRHITSIE